MIVKLVNGPKNGIESEVPPDTKKIMVPIGMVPGQVAIYEVHPADTARPKRRFLFKGNSTI